MTNTDMPTGIVPVGSLVIVGLEQNGYRLYGAISDYCTSMGYDTSDKTIMAIYHEIVSQVVYNYSDNPSEYLTNLTILPTFTLIQYGQAEPSLEIKTTLSRKVQAFGAVLYNAILSIVPPQILGSYYSLEVVSVTLLGLRRYNHGIDHQVNHDFPGMKDTL